MENYYSNTPYYKIWISVIDYITPKSSFLLSEFNYEFKDIVCTRESLVITYIKRNLKLELVYAQDYSSYFCRLIAINTDSIKEWTSPPPLAKQNLKTFSDLEDVIDEWMLFLKTEL